MSEQVGFVLQSIVQAPGEQQMNEILFIQTRNFNTMRKDQK